MKNWETAAHYQLLHAMPLIFIGNKATLRPAALLMTFGVVLFSGSIYALSLKPEWRSLAIATPVGGSLLVSSWLAIAALW